MVELGKYRHYKGGEYEVIALALIEADHTPVVVYKSLEVSGEFPVGTVWVRPVSEFEEMVQWEHGEVARFAKLD